MAARKREVAAAAPAPPDFLVLGLAAAGFAIAAYLTWLKWTGGDAAFCLSGSGCDIVQSSRYGTLLGVPTALWGVALYAAIGALAVLGLRRPRWAWAVYLAAGGVGFSVYLTAVSALVIRAACAYCLASAGIMLAVLLVLLWRRGALPGRRPGLAAFLPGALAAAVLVPVAAAFIYAMPAGGGAGFEGALARHLRESGAVMYGAYWCPHCTEQKALFGDAATNVPYVECAADGVNGRPDLCEKVGVKTFPTWIMGTERREGVQSLSALAAFSGFDTSK
ncbi:MAG: vitamin K epoxide reductase family protein [Candidatus Rokuibacteriota bacterium]